jgi:hypothetical protein
MSKVRFYYDGTCSAVADWKAVRAARKGVAEALLGYAGTQKAGEDAKDYLYHHGLTPPAWLYCKQTMERLVIVTGHIFFRHCPSAPSQWLIVSMGAGRPSQAQCSEALRRFNRSFTF